MVERSNIHIGELIVHAFKESYVLFKENVTFFSLVVFLFFVTRVGIYFFLDNASTFATEILRLYELMVVVLLVYYIAKRKSSMGFTHVMHKGATEYWRALALLIIRIILVGLLTLLFVIPGILFYFFWQFALYFLLYEGVSIRESLYLSRKLAQYHWKSCLTYFAVVHVLVAVSYFFLFLLYFVPATMYTLRVIAMFGYIVFHIIQIVFTVQFYERLRALSSLSFTQTELQKKELKKQSKTSAQF